MRPKTLRMCLPGIAFLLFLLTPYAVFSQGDWTLIGSEINGKAAGDNAGGAVSLSASGYRIAIGSLSNAGGGAARGQVRVFENTNSGWVQIGADLNGETNGEAFGRSISLDSAGTTLIVGGPYNDGGFGPFSNTGHARVFSWNGTSWIQKGNDFDGDIPGANYGHSVSISGNGTTIAIGSPFSAGGGASRGVVNIFQWNEALETWEQLGSGIEGEADNDIFGSSVSLDHNGTSVAVGAPFNNGSAPGAGHCRVFTYNGTSWIQKGIDIDGAAASDFSGNAVSLSADGETVAVGAPQDFIMGGYGSARVFSWSGTAWEQQGSIITSDLFADSFGEALSLSPQGENIVIGARANVPGNPNGRVEVYQWQNSDWELVGDTLKGSHENDQFGMAVSLSYNGNIIAAGAPASNNNGPASGTVGVFKFCTPSYVTIDTTSCATQFTSFSGKYIWDESGIYKDTLLNMAGCDSVLTINLSLVAQPFVNLGSDINVCADSVVLDAGNAGAAFLWSNGETSQKITVEANGSYHVEVSNGICTDDDTINVLIKNPTASSAEIVSCTDEYQSPSGKYTWTTSGIYSDTLTNKIGCDSVFTINLSLLTQPVVDLGPDIIICADSIVLDAGNAGAGFSWSNGETSQKITIQTIGTYHVEVANDICTDKDTINVYINKHTASSFEIVSCTEEYQSPSGKYTWTTSGIYSDTLTNKVGCDSVVTINLSLLTQPVVDLGPDIVLCADSVVLDAGNAGAAFLWSNGETSQKISVETIGTYHVEVANGICTDKDTINVNINKHTASSLEIVSCTDEYQSPSGKYTWTTSGIYSDTLTNKVGCDSVVTINLSLLKLPVVDLGPDIIICADSVVLDAGNGGAGFLWSNGATSQKIGVETTGTYHVEVANGICIDSDTINVYINQSTASSLDIVSCTPEYQSPSGRYTWTTPGVYSDTLLNKVGCDSVVTINLSFRTQPVVDLGPDILVCADSLVLDAGNEGAEFLWSNGSTSQKITVAALGTYHVQVSNGICTDTDTIGVYIFKSTSSSVDIVSCTPEYKSPSGKYTWTTPGIYADTVRNKIGCDSVMTINLTFGTVPVVNLGEDIAACKESVTLDAGNVGATYLWDNNKTTQTIDVIISGDYRVKVTLGTCSAYDTIAINLLKATASTLSASSCKPEYISPSGKYTWTTAGVYKDTLTNKAGCDSLMTINLSFGTVPVVNLGEDKTECGDSSVLDAGNAGATYLWSNGQATQTITATTSGTYHVKVTNGICVDYDTVAVNLVNLNVDMTRNGDVVTMTEPKGSYRWFDCSNNMAVLQSGNNRSYFLDGCVGDSYNLAVEVSRGGCKDTTICQTFELNRWYETATIVGKQFNFAGYSHLSANGNVLAVGNIRNDTLSEVQIYQHDGVSWTKRGKSIYAESTGDAKEGFALDLSTDGNIVAIGAHTNSGNGENSGNVRVFNWTGTDWKQLGANINGRRILARFGSFIALSGDGTMLAVGNRPLDLQQPFASVFRWDGETWVQQGAEVPGRSVALSDDGKTFLAGNPAAAKFSGVATVYEWDGTKWRQKGSDFTGTEDEDLGHSVDISSSGNLIVISAPGGGSGKVKVYEFNGQEWKQKGSDITGPGSLRFGHELSLSSDGSMLAAGNVSHLKVLKWNGSDWVQSGANVEGYNTSILLCKISLSGSGNRLAYGIPIGANGSGEVRIFELCNSVSDTPVGVEEEVSMSRGELFTVFPNPSKGSFTIKTSNGQPIDHLEIYGIVTHVVHSKSFQRGVTEATINLESEPDGIYLIKVESKGKRETLRLVLQK